MPEGKRANAAKAGGKNLLPQPHHKELQSGTTPLVHADTHFAKYSLASSAGLYVFYAGNINPRLYAKRASIYVYLIIFGRAHMHAAALCTR